MRRALHAWAALLVVAVWLSASFAAIWFDAGAPNFRRDPLGGIALMLAFGAFATVGALVLWRRPGNAMGWVLGAVGVLAALGGFAETYLSRATDDRETSWFFQVTAWFGTWYWFPLIMLVLVFPLILFPDGRPVSPRWRPLLWLATTGTLLLTVAAATGMDVEEGPIGGLLTMVMPAILFLALVSTVVRFRRSRGLERQQLKWFMFAGVLMVSLILASELLPVFDSVESDAPFALVITTLPVAMGMAILRYRLYEIDRIISRTLTYATVVGLLAAVYAGAVFVLGWLLPVEGDMEVAGSTLAVAALFGPLRRRVQRWVDRRFNRSRYDADQEVSRFTERLRNEVELGVTIADLIGVVTRTVQPVSTGVWLRKPPS